MTIVIRYRVGGGGLVIWGQHEDIHILVISNLSSVISLLVKRYHDVLASQKCYLEFGIMLETISASDKICSASAVDL